MKILLRRLSRNGWLKKKKLEYDFYVQLPFEIAIALAVIQEKLQAY